MPSMTSKRGLTPAAEWMRSIRTNLGVSQNQFAAMIGSKKANISNYERGIANVPRELVPAIARVTGRSRAEVRRALDLWEDGDTEDAPVPPLSIRDAIRADTTLIPEAREHLLRQYALLLRIQRDKDQVEMDAKHAQWEAAEATDSSVTEPSRTGIRRQG